MPNLGDDEIVGITSPISGFPAVYIITNASFVTPQSTDKGR